MRQRDTSDVIASAVAVAADAFAILGGFLLAIWLRFESGWVPLRHEKPPEHLYFVYGWASIIATLLFLFLFRALGLYVRPQTGGFGDKIPRLIRAIILGILMAMVFAFAIRTAEPFSRLTVLIAAALVGALVLIERYALFRWEFRLAHRSASKERVLILGVEEVAAHLARALVRDPRLRVEVIGFLRTDEAAPHPEVVPARILGAIGELEPVLAEHKPDRVILTSSRPGHSRIVEIILHCERNLVTFNMVPDLFRIMLGDMKVQIIDDIPLLGISRWPLDMFWNRLLKRMADIVGSIIGLVVSLPIIALAAVAIRRSSTGPVFYRQERCGEEGRLFTLYKLRTMCAEAEAATGPVWATANDARKTPVGAVLRRYNIDELPQFWNVLKGDMSLVGPRPERPTFVEQFKEDIQRYMWRHVSKPGMTGWAQVNGLRGNTSLEERIRYDLYYLENWSLAFDFKILLRTFFATENAY